ncbi:hypothetical protein [Kosakonia sacchari]|uniref:hypothetical protein n=1 Tax=Kosakonia sacchari TaxID=1158459 RepID=UPI003F572BF6
MTARYQQKQFLRLRTGAAAVIIAFDINKTATSGDLRFGGAFQINWLSPGVTHHHLRAVAIRHHYNNVVYFLALFIQTPETKKPDLRQLPDDQVSPACTVTIHTRTSTQLYSSA